MTKTLYRTTLHRALIGLTVAGFLTLAAAQQDANSMGAGAASGNSAKPGTSDQRFMKEAAQGGMAEVELGKLAVQNASSDEVKKFGQRMVDDHSKANDKLKELASAKGITLPQAPNAKQKATKDQLSKLSGEQFDKAYMRDMLKDHKQDIAAFQSESNIGHDADVKNFATQTLPTLRDHLKDAQGIAPKVLQARSSIQPTSSQ
jgi:putative membrane protein